MSASHHGVDAFAVEVEVDLAPGVPSYVTVGLPDTAVKESQSRILAALKNSGFEAPIKKITVNLAPADIRKEGTSFDLPIAVAMLSAQGIVPSDKLENLYMIGELALDGRVKSIRGALSVSIAVKQNGGTLLLPSINAKEAAVVNGVKVIPVETLTQAVEWLSGEVDIQPARAGTFQLDAHCDDELDFMEVKGQAHVRRSMEVAVAGGHNVLMVGPPGAGKSMIARRLPTIMPGWSLEEAIETSRIHSVAGAMPEGASILNRRPFRAPHHTISTGGLVGGGGANSIYPGEVSLAHYGVLFLDELPEFRRSALEALRQPLEDGLVVISRATSSVTFPSRFMLVCAMNPCPCGYSTDPIRECSCAHAQMTRYRQKISGPLMDRIDIQVEVPSVKFRELQSNDDNEPSSLIRERVMKASNMQNERFSKSKIFKNSEMTNRHIKKYCEINRQSQLLLKNAMEKLGFSARGYSRTLKVAKTIADLAGTESISTEHIAEAIQYRLLPL